jgi:hypothetical protein
MKTKFPIFITLVVLILALLKTNVQATNLPDSILALETFGAGMNKVHLPPGKTTYNFNGNSNLKDGDYMIYRYTNGRPEWLC